MRQEYALRAGQQDRYNRYTYSNPEYVFTLQQRERHLLQLVTKAGLDIMGNMRVLEIGCGSGGVLLDFLRYGSNPCSLFGLDLLADRLVEAHSRLPLAGINCADGQMVPFPSQTFNLVLQFTAFSSVLDYSIRSRMASEMLRVLKPDGAIIWYDFWLNPTNPQTHGIRPAEIRNLFPSCKYNFRRITLAPPIAFRIVPLSWHLAQFLEALKIFNSHYLVLIRKNPA